MPMNALRQWLDLLARKIAHGLSRQGGEFVPKPAMVHAIRLQHGPADVS